MSKTEAATERERIAARLEHEEAELREIAARRREIAVGAALGEERAMHEARTLDADEEGHARRAELCRLALEVLEDA